MRNIHNFAERTFRSFLRLSQSCWTASAQVPHIRSSTNRPPDCRARPGLAGSRRRRWFAVRSTSSPAAAFHLRSTAILAH